MDGVVVHLDDVQSRERIRSADRGDFDLVGSEAVVGTTDDTLRNADDVTNLVVRTTIDDGDSGHGVTSHNHVEAVRPLPVPSSTPSIVPSV